MAKIFLNQNGKYILAVCVEGKRWDRVSHKEYESRRRAHQAATRMGLVVLGR